MTLEAVLLIILVKKNTLEQVHSICIDNINSL